MGAAAVRAVQAVQAAGRVAGRAGTGGSAPQVITQPGDQSVQSGRPAAFVTVAGGVVTGAQWQVSTDAGADWSNVPYATAMSYSFLAATGENVTSTARC